MNEKLTLGMQLLRIARLFKENSNHFNEELELLIQEVIEGGEIEHALNRREVVILAHIWNETITNGYQHFDPVSILQELFGNSYAVVEYLDDVCNLVRYRILDTSTKKIKTDNMGTEVYVTIEKEKLIKSDITLSDMFLRKLISPSTRERDEQHPYESNKDFIQDWFRYLSALEDYSRVRMYMEISDENEAGEELYIVTKRKRRIESRLAVTERKFPLQILAEEYGLNHKEQIILMYLVKTEIEGNSCEPDEVLEIVSKDRLEFFRNKRYLMSDAPLISSGMIEICNHMGFRTYEEIRLTRDTVLYLLSEQQDELKLRLEDMLRGNPLLDCEYPSQKMSDLVLKRELKEILLNSLAKYQHQVYSVLKQWRIFDERFGNGESLTILLSGLPGTGKTFCAKAIANYLNRPLLYTDISRILSAWVGESEKNVRSLFSSYERIGRQLKKYPVLLLNEADQFFLRRGNVDKSVDRMYNQMQNLFLESLEKYKGILVCTTNLLDNIDPAFSRRFHLKLVFPRPDYDERLKLWKLHLPDTIPGLEELDLYALARKYELTGGQIAIIVKNAATEAAGRENGKRKLLQSDLERFCQLELSSSFEESRLRIGF